MLRADAKGHPHLNGQNGFKARIREGQVTKAGAEPQMPRRRKFQ